jgi:hypothetical protein
MISTQRDASVAQESRFTPRILMRGRPFPDHALNRDGLVESESFSC